MHRLLLTMKMNVPNASASISLMVLLRILNAFLVFCNIVLPISLQLTRCSCCDGTLHCAEPSYPLKLGTLSSPPDTFSPLVNDEQANKAAASLKVFPRFPSPPLPPPCHPIKAVWWECNISVMRALVMLCLCPGAAYPQSSGAVSSLDMLLKPVVLLNLFNRN